MAQDRPNVRWYPALTDEAQRWIAGDMSTADYLDWAFDPARVRRIGQQVYDDEVARTRSLARTNGRRRHAA